MQCFSSSSCSYLVWCVYTCMSVGVAKSAWVLNIHARLEHRSNSMQQWMLEGYWRSSSWRRGIRSVFKAFALPYTHDTDHVAASVNSVQCSIQFKQIQCSEIPKECTVLKGRLPARYLWILIVLSHFLAVTGNRAQSLIKAFLLVVIKNIFFVPMLPVGNNFSWIRPQCEIIESRVTACRVFFSRNRKTSESTTYEVRYTRSS